jgi:hypothetical protein
MYSVQTHRDGSAVLVVLGGLGERPQHQCDITLPAGINKISLSLPLSLIINLLS